MGKLSTLLIESKHEASDLRTSFWFIVGTDIIDNNHSLGLDIEIPSTMNLLSNASNIESKQNELYESILKEVEYLHMNICGETEIL